jgi:hypothetical protein
MTSIQNYFFDRMGRIGADTTDNTQRTVSNTKFANYMLSNYYGENLSDSHVNFATQQPNVMFSGITWGKGLSGSVIDVDSLLLINSEKERPLEKLQLMQRPFATVPYLGRGSCNPTIESQLQQGEIVSDKKSVSTIMEKSFCGYTLFPSDDSMVQKANDASNKVEELAMNGWVRGGMASREMAADTDFRKNSRPNDSGY